MSTIVKFNNKILRLNNKTVGWWTLPPVLSNIVRVRTNDGNLPIKSTHTKYETAILVPGTTDVYDVYKSGTRFDNLLCYSTNIIEVIEANTSNITRTNNMFQGCTNLKTVHLFDISNATDISYMFYGCENLKTIPLFDTSNATDMSNMFELCSNVEAGALALYQQASSQANPPTNHYHTFYKCGINTETGAAELAQIPSDWK